MHRVDQGGETCCKNEKMSMEENQQEGVDGATDRDAQKHGFKKCIILSQAFQHLRVARYVDENRQGILRNWLKHRVCKKSSKTART